MDYETIEAKITANAYDSKLEYPTGGSSPEERVILKMERTNYREDAGRLFVEFKDDCRAYATSRLGILTEKAWNSIWTHAWDEGHSSGYHEVLQYLCSILEIIEAVIKR